MGKLNPWHMWGASEIISLREEAGAPPQGAQSVQLSNVQYGRPETFAFFLFADIVGATPGQAFGDLAVNVDFQISFGLGLNRFGNQPFPAALPTTGQGQQGFVRFGWRRFVGDPITRGANKWSQSASTPELDENEAAPVRRQVEYVVAENIQCSAVASVPLIGGAPGTIQQLQVKVGSFFCPLSHVRPDWFVEDGEQFLGNEVGGR